MASAKPILARSRLLAADRTALAADNGDYGTQLATAEFIVVAQIDEEKGPWNAQYKLQWRDVTDAGSFADLASTGEIKWGTGTSLTNGTAVTVRACTGAGGSGSTWQNGEEVEGASTADAINLADEYYTEIHFACSGATANHNHQYEFQLYDATNSSAIGTLAAAITIQNSSPTVALGTPADNATVTDNTPALTFTGTDAEGNTVDYQGQVDTANTFDSGGSGSFDLKYIDVEMYKGNSPTDNLTIDVRSSSFGGSSLGTSNTVASSSLSAYPGGTVRFTFATPITLSSNTTYFLVMARSGARDLTNVAYWSKNNSSVYSGGVDQSNDSGTWANTLSPGDFTFTLYDESLTAKITQTTYDSALGVYGGIGASQELGQSFTTPPDVPLVNGLSTDHTGFSAGASHPTASGVEQTYTVQSALPAGTYYWRFRAIDPSGSNTWGAWSPGDSTLGYDHFHLSTGTDVTVNVSAAQSVTSSQPAPTISTVRNATVTPTVQTATFNPQAPTISTVRNVTVALAAAVACIFSAPDASVTAGSDFTLNPSALELTSSQPEPTVTAVRNISLSAGVQSVVFSQPSATVSPVRNLTLSSELVSATFSQPAATVTAVQHTSISPDVQSLTTSAPNCSTSTSSNTNIQPSALSLVGSQPDPTVTAIQNASVSPDAQIATFSQPAATVVVSTNVSVSSTVQSLSFSQPEAGASAIQNVTVSPDAQTVTATAPNVSTSTQSQTTIQPSALSLTGNAISPTVTAIQHVTVTPDAQTVAANLLDATVSTAWNTTHIPDAQTAGFSQATATISTIQNATVSPLAQEVAFTAPNCSVSSGESVTIQPSAVSSAFDQPSPAVTAIRNVTTTPDALALTASQGEASVSTTRNITISPDVQGLLASAPNVSISTEGQVTLQPSALNLTGNLPSPTVSGVQNVSVVPDAESLTATQPEVTVSTSWNTTQVPNVQTLTFSQQSLAVSAIRNATLSPAVQAGTFSAPNASVSAGGSITAQPSIQSALFSQPAATITTVRNVTVSPNAQSAVFSQASPTVSTVRNETISPAVQGFTVSAPDASISTQGWYNASWNYRVKVTVLASKVDADLTDYPVYVDLSNLPADFHTNVNQTDARDIRVTTANGTTELPREVVSYNSTTDTGELHFKASIDGDTDTDFYVYYGNTAATEPAADSTYGSQNAWNSNYLGVWHLKDGTDDSHISDSTAGGYTGTKRTSDAPAEIAATISTGQSFTATNNDYISMGDVIADGLDKITVQAWVSRTADRNTYETIVSKWYENLQSPFWFGVAGGVDDTLYFYVQDNGTTQVNTHSAVTIPSDGTPKMVHATSDGANIRVYVNGAASGTPTGFAHSLGLTNKNLMIGKEDTANNYPWGGYIDEVRILQDAMTATWISTEYNNQSSPSTFYQLGAQETQPGVTNVTISAGVESLTSTQLAPTVSTAWNTTHIPDAQSLVLSQQSPTVSATQNVTLSADPQVGTLSALDVSITAGGSITLNPSVQTANFSQPAATVSTVRNVTVSAGVQTGTLSQVDPTIRGEATISPNAQNAVFSQADPSISTTTNVTVSAEVQSGVFSNPNASVVAGGSVTTQPSTQVATFNQPSPSVAAVQNVTLEPEVQIVTFSQPDPSVTAIQSVDTTITPDVQAAVFSGPNVSVSTTLGTTVRPSVQQAIFSLPNVTLELVRNVTITVPAAVIGPYKFIFVDGNLAMQLTKDHYTRL